MKIIFLTSFFALLSQAQNMFFHLLPGFVPAYTWVGLGADTNWSTAGNWSTGAIPGAGNTAFFDSNCASNCNATINSSISVAGFNIRSTYTGTITQGAGNTITVGASGWTQQAGTFAGGDSAIIMNGAFALTGGTYTATSGTWTHSANYSIGGGSFNANGGKILFSRNGGQVFAFGLEQYSDVEFRPTAWANLDLSATTMTINGTLTLAAYTGCASSCSLLNGTINAKGAVYIVNDGLDASVNLRIVGNSSQLIDATAANATTSWIPRLELASTGGTVSLAGTLRTQRHFTYTSGAVDSGTSTVVFWGSQNITPGSVDFYDVTFGSSGWAAKDLMTGTLKVQNNLTLASYAGCANNCTLNNGTIEAYKNVTILNSGITGNANITFVGTGAQSLTGSGSGFVPSVTVNKSSGTLSIVDTIIVSSNWTQTLGTVDAGTSTVQFSTTSATQIFTPGAISYYRINFVGEGTTINLNGGTLNLTNTFTIGDTAGVGFRGSVSNGSINASGNVVFANDGKNGNAILNFTGAANTTLTIGASAATLATTHNVAKTGTAKVSLVATTNYSTAGRNFSITSGVLDMAGFNFTVNSAITIGASGTLLCNGGTATAGTWSIAGQISCGGTTNQGITWTGQAGDNLWSTAGNWTNNTIPSTNDVAFFNSAICVAAQCNAQIDSNLSVRGLHLQSTYTGTLTQNATRTLTVGTGGYTQAGGTFAGGNAAITMNGVFTLSGGTFTATSGTWTQSANMTISGAPTFNHNSGSWTTSTSITISPNGSTFNNVTFGGNYVAQNLNAGIMITTGTLTLIDNHALGSLNNGTIEARGDVSISTLRGKIGSALIKINGTGAQTLIGGAGLGQVPHIEINKPSGTLTLTNTILVSGNWTFTAGTVDAGTSTLTFYGTQIITPGSVVYNHVSLGGNYVAQDLNAGTMIVAGTLTLNDSHSLGQINNGTIEARGDMTLINHGKIGSALIKINGTGAQLITGGPGTGQVPHIEINKPSGTLTLANTIIVSGNWTYTAGTVDTGTSTLTFNFNQTITSGSVVYNNVSFGGSLVSQNLNASTMIVGGILTLNDGFSTGTLNNGTVEARGDITLLSHGKQGTALIKINGTGAQSLTGGAGVGNVPHIEIDKPSGTLTLAGTLRVWGNWTHTAGTVNAGTSTLQFEAIQTITAGAMSYNNVTLVGGAVAQNLNASTMIITGTLTLNGSHTTSSVNNGTIEARGNIVITGQGKIGTATLVINGLVSSTVTWTTGSFMASTITAAKTGGASVSLATNAAFSTAGRDLTVSSGTLDLNGFDLTVNDVLTVGAGATLKCNGGEIANPQPASVVNSGTINCPGYATYDFNWTGAGGDTNFNTAGNWQGGVAPTASDLVVFQDTYCGATCNATVNTAISIRGARLRSPYTGTITQGAGNSLTMGTRGWTQAAGTFSGGDGAIVNNGNYDLSGGTFTSTSGTLTLGSGLSGARTWNVGVGGTFVHNNGTVLVQTAAVSTTFFTGGANPYFDLNFATFSGSYTISGTTTVNNNFQFGSAGSSTMNFSGGTINVAGDVTCYIMGSANNVATTVIHVNGTGPQTLTGTSSCTWPSITIDKPSGTATLSGEILSYGTFIYTAGTIAATGSKLTLYATTGAKTHSPNGITLNDVQFSTWGTGTHNLNSQTINIDGILTFSGTSSAGTVGSGTINARGNIVQTGTVNFGGSVALNITGTTDTTLTPSGTLNLPGTVTINKTAGAKVTLLGNTFFNNAGQNLTITAGTLDMAGFDLTVGNNISNSGVLKRGNNPSCGTVTHGGSYSGTAAICP